MDFGGKKGEGEDKEEEDEEGELWGQLCLGCGANSSVLCMEIKRRVCE